MASPASKTPFTTLLTLFQQGCGWCWILACFLAVSEVQGQDGARGGLRGSVVDADFFVPIGNVGLILEPGGQTAVTDAEGRFFINDLPPGVYRATLQAEGFIRTSKSGIVISSGSVAEANIEMTAQVVELDEFVVQADVETGTTDITPLGLSADLSAIASSINPELLKAAGSGGDIGSSLRRLAGVSVADSRYVVVRGLSDRYNVVVLNGARLPSSDPDKRAVNIDIFPTGLVETIVSAKTVTPSMPGEVTGGYLNIVTKRVPDEPFFHVSTSYGSNSNSTGRSDFLSYKGGGTGFLGSAGSRALPSFMSDVNALPTDPREYLGDASQNPLNPNDPGYIAHRNRLRAASSLNGRPMGTSYKEAPMDFSLSVMAGTRVEDFMGGTLGLLGGFTYSKKYVMEEGVRGFANAAAGTPVATEQFQFARGQESLLAGALLSASLEFSPEDSITLTYFANVSAQDDAIFSIGETAVLGTLDNGIPIDQEEIVIFREFMYYTERRLQTLQLAGQHGIDGIAGAKIDWLVSYSMSSQDQPDLRKANYAYSYALNDYVGTGDPAPPDLERVWRRLDDTNYNIALNAEIPLDESAAAGGPGVIFKFGGAFDYSTRKYRSDNFEYSGLPSATLIADYLNVTPGGPILGSPTANNAQTLTLGDLIGDLDLIDSVLIPTAAPGTFRIRDNFFLSRAFNVPPIETYEATQVIPAAYGQFTFKSDDFETTFGARVESTLISVDVAQFASGGGAGNFLGQFGSLDFEIDRIDVLPSVSTKWEVSESSTIRAAVSQSVARPTFKEIAVVFSRDPETGNFFVGNPELEMSDIINFDLRYEYAPTNGNQFAVSFFSKLIDKPIEFVNLGVFNTARNEESATLYGFELEGYYKLENLIEELHPFTWGFNFGYVFSKVQLSEDSALIRRQAGFSRDRPLQGQPDYTFNTSLTYDHKDSGVVASLLLNVTGPMLHTVGGRFESNLTPDIYQRPFTSLDLNLSKKLNERWTLNFRATNLLNEPRQRVFDGGLPFAVTYNGTGYSLGLTGKW